MKCLTLYVHEAVLDPVLDVLRATPGIDGFTVVPCQGHSTRSPSDPFTSLRDRVAGHTPRMRIEIVLPGATVDELLDRVRGTLPAGSSTGAYVVHDAERFGRL